MRLFIFLCVLGAGVSQATAGAVSTQMYYFKLTIEESAVGNLTSEFFVNNSNLRVDDLDRTTTCKTVGGGRQCRCLSGHRWSDNMCQSAFKCCGIDPCTVPINSTHVCISNETVITRGTMTLHGTRFQGCVTEEDSEEFRICSNNLTHEMKNVYSTLNGFDDFRITKFSHGSIIVDFEMTTSKAISHQDLSRKSETLVASLKGSIVLETTGFVNLMMPDSPVKYSSQNKLVCSSTEDMSSPAVWQLRNVNGKVFPITNGTEAGMLSTLRTSTLSLKNASAPWKGEYTCEYQLRNASLSIRHRASADLDIALLPNIYIATVPQFPLCHKTDDLVVVKAACLIGDDKEAYSVRWTGRNTKAKIIKLKTDSSSVHKASTAVGCVSTEPRPKITCTFQNRHNQTRSASVEINIIYEGDRFCEADGDWGNTKAGFTAVLRCTDQTGQRKRKCNRSATWEEEEAECVNRDVATLLHHAKMVGIGLGSLNENAALVFSTFGNVTNNTRAINTNANMRAAVDVFSVVSEQHRLQLRDSAVDDFLESSSNLLEKSLEQTWKEKDGEGNESMAEKYMTSVEKLIGMADIRGTRTKRNIEVVTCNQTQGSKCTNTAFGVTVALESDDSGTVMSAGFKQLQNYLPQQYERYKMNSIVMSTTTRQIRSDSVTVQIKFQLLRSRPRNVMMKCVSWDHVTRQWSTAGCQWKPDGYCTCSHLSTFALLMQRDPIVLPWMSEITLCGLSASVVSLVINLIIELTIWTAVVKTSASYLRHTAHVNISICLLVADCCFLASYKPNNISEIWCKTFVVLKHFFYLSMFFWILCLSSTLLHQTVFPFHNVSKKAYLIFSIILGYLCPLLIVFITFLSNNNGAEGVYYFRDTCWLVYSGRLLSSIHMFIIPVGAIVIINMSSMVLVILKLLAHTQRTKATHHKSSAKTAIRAVVLLTPIFGVTWFFGFFVTYLDLVDGFAAYAANYGFILLNSFQGLFILLTTFPGDKLTREALLNRLKIRSPPCQ